MAEGSALFSIYLEISDLLAHLVVVLLAGTGHVKFGGKEGFSNVSDHVWNRDYLDACLLFYRDCQLLGGILLLWQVVKEDRVDFELLLGV